MSKLQLINASSLEKLLFDLGFIKTRQKGSHAFYRHPDGRTTTIPFHIGRDLPRPLLRSILNEIKLTSFDDVQQLSSSTVTAIVIASEAWRSSLQNIENNGLLRRSLLAMTVWESSSKVLKFALSKAVAFKASRARFHGGEGNIIQFPRIIRNKAMRRVATHYAAT